MAAPVEDVVHGGDDPEAYADMEGLTTTTSTAGTVADANALDMTGNILAEFQNVDGDAVGPAIDLPVAVTVPQLNALINKLLDNDDTLPYSFLVNDAEVTESVAHSLAEHGLSRETTLQIVFQPQAVFRVRSVTRCGATLPGHDEAVLSVHFSPNGQRLASGSGDATVRVWDLMTNTPEHTLEGHKSWVMCVAWSPDGKMLVSGGHDGTVRLWDPETGKKKGKPMRKHTRWITALAWEPLHLNRKCTRVASASKDRSVHIWDVVRGQSVLSLAQHTESVACLRWTGAGHLITGSHDRTIKIWNSENGKLIRTLSGHAHWINTMALSTDYVLRTGAHDHRGRAPDDEDDAAAAAEARFQAVVGSTPERLVTGSDDNTMYLWEPESSKKPIARLTGHQQPINQVSFSPDGRVIASASFDKTVKLWDGFTGKFIANLRGHVQRVYQVAWSSDSRLLVSGSKDSTLKVWSLKTKKLMADLPGHYDEVYAVDWSPDGERVASGSKDRVCKIWRR